MTPKQALGRLTILSFVLGVRLPVRSIPAATHGGQICSSHSFSKKRQPLPCSAPPSKLFQRGMFTLISDYRMWNCFISTCHVGHWSPGLVRLLVIWTFGLLR